MNNIVWIASFPRSGNTWLRCFLSNLSGEASQLNALDSMHCANRVIAEDVLCFSTSELNASESALLRPDIYRYFAHSWNSTNPLFMKVHDCFQRNSEGELLFPQDVSRAAIYLIRNPLDVCVSYTHFWGENDYDATAELMCDKWHSLPFVKTNLFGQFYQHIGDWSLNVKTWTEQCDFPVRVVRYEDMLETPTQTFSRIIKFLSLHYDKDEIHNSLRKSEFSQLQKAEEVSGFSDRPYNGERFFRSGRSGVWRDKLSKDAVKRIIDCHGDLMFAHGYLREDGMVVV